MPGKVTAPVLRSMKAKGEKIAVITAYDYSSALLADAAGVDAILVGDSLGNVVLGYDTTVPVSLEDMERHVAAVSRGTSRAHVIGDLPFGSYQESVSQAVASSVRLMKAGAQSVKLEGAYTEAVEAIVRAGIPVCGHVGFTPQSVHAFGGFRVQGRENGDAVLDAALALEQAGVYAIVLELIPAALAESITARLSIPTIGIGAGPVCDGQVQVFHDLLGLTSGHFKHAKRYVEAGSILQEAIERYSEEVKNGSFPTSENSF
ncbi:MAG TPA: 3-methyl-2-oxobutanoate hydroxymethyltransferase [Fimbriimonadaceae bacterium]|nr:3-methyl-2-oxobutanoate hydroxymethyltransferase [Fimbriimonadaceae bacterium]